MADAITIRTHLPSEWITGEKKFFDETWVVDADSDKVLVTVLNQYPDDNLDWDFPSGAAISLGESLIRYARVVDSRKNLSGV